MKFSMHVSRRSFILGEVVKKTLKTDRITEKRASYYILDLL